MRRVLITGGSGFLGKRLARALKPRFDVVIGARNGKLLQAAEHATGCQATPLDVARIESVRDALREFKPSILIHAAATKFVDRAEREPFECIDVNVVGSENVARAAIECGVETVIGVSTDKASPPVRNTYGLSKAIMERLFSSLDGKSATSFACVRYGNVAWSTGSVLPIWRRMHLDTGVIGTTGPEMRRFFFTVDEAVRLVETALDRIGEIRGGVLSREMKSAQIEDMLRTWTAEKGGRWEKIAGRPGERIDEFLIGESELPYTVEQAIDGVPHYLITFNRQASKPLQQVISSATATRLTPKEMAVLINNPPEEELH